MANHRVGHKGINANGMGWPGALHPRDTHEVLFSRCVNHHNSRCCLASLLLCKDELSTGQIEKGIPCFYMTIMLLLELSTFRP